MNILLTGATGYIGHRIIPVLLDQGHTIYCCVRDRRKFEKSHPFDNIRVIEIDFLYLTPASEFPYDLDVAFFLVHAMRAKGDFSKMEAQIAQNFVGLIEKTKCKQIIYLSGIVNEEILSDHLSSRFTVEKILKSGSIPVTVLRAGIIVGAGSASFEIIRDLMEKLPILVAPKWLNTLCQPISIQNVVEFLSGVMLKEKTFNKEFDIGGPDVLSYKEMLLQYAEVRKLKRRIYIFPVISPRISSYWLYFITSTTYRLAINLVDSMKVNMICNKNTLAEDLDIKLHNYKEAVDKLFRYIDENMVVGCWTDAFQAFESNPELMKLVKVPKFGCYQDNKTRTVRMDNDKLMQRIWSIGGNTGWNYGNFLCRLRGFLDKLVGGIGLSRGRSGNMELKPGDTIDFWRVLVADRPNRRLLLFAEMKIPGEAWLEFQIEQNNGLPVLRQTATFRPRGIFGRVYWFIMWPFHFLIFNGMINNLVKESS